MLTDFGLTFDGTVSLHRRISGNGNLISKGLGRTRHSDVHYLWIQEEVAEGRLKVDNVGTKENLAVILTKAVGRDVMLRALASTRHRAEQYTCSQSA